MTHQSECQDDINRSTDDYLLWKMKKKMRGRGRDKKNEGVKGHFVPDKVQRL